MKYLVTGAAGFLGSHLTNRLLNQGNQVVGLDNYLTGNEKNLEFARSHRSFNFIEADVVEPFSLEVDGIFNLACPASPVQYQRNPVETIRTSFLGSLNTLQLATTLGVKVLQASTSEVYGDPEVSPQDEEYWGNVNPIGIRSCYDEGKRAAETLFFDHLREYGTRIKIARIFNTYGPKMSFNDGRVVSNFVLQALQNNDITVYGDGTQTRSFCFVDDTVSGLISLFDSSDEITGPINIGNPIEFTMLELAEKIINLTNSKSTIIYEDLPSDDPRQRKPEISKAKKLIDWAPKVSLDEGLEIMISDFKMRLNL
jgi:UDP-glucuronate decarboxylase